MLALALTILAAPPSLDGITDREGWARRRAEVLKGMEAAMGELPRGRPPLDVAFVGDAVKGEGFTRRKLTYQSEKGHRVPAWILVPDGAGKKPAMLCLHQTTREGKDEPAGLNKNEQLHYALHLVKLGYVCLAPDYPSFGEHAYDFAKSKHPSGSIKAVWDNIRGVDYLCSRPDVDPERIGVIGHSLGGHNALFTACFDTRLKAVVTNCGFTSFPRYYGGKIKGWTSARYMPRLETVYKLDPKGVPFDFPQVLAAIAPRAVLASSPLKDDNFEVAGVRECIAAARPIFELLGAKDALQANYPDCGHSFPPEARKVAYDFLGRHLKPRSSP
jgi:acetyl esterase/lipase